MTKHTKTEAPAATSPQIIELAELAPREGAGSRLLDGRLGAVQNVKARMTVVAGSATISIGDLLNMKSEQIVRLDSLMDEPVDILLEGVLVARGQLVAVDDNFGVRILELPKEEC